MKKKGLASLLTAVAMTAGMAFAVPASAAETAGNTVIIKPTKDACVQTWKGEKLNNYGAGWDIRLSKFTGTSGNGLYEDQVNKTTGWAWDTGNETDWKIGYIGFSTVDIPDAERIEKAELRFTVRSNESASTLYVMEATNEAYKVGKNEGASLTMVEGSWVEGTGDGSGISIATEDNDIDPSKGIAFVVKPQVVGIDDTHTTFANVAIATADVSNMKTKLDTVTVDVTDYIKSLTGESEITLAVAADGVMSLATKEAEAEVDRDEGDAATIVITTKAEEQPETTAAASKVEVEGIENADANKDAVGYYIKDVTLDGTISDYNWVLTMNDDTRYSKPVEIDATVEATSVSFGIILYGTVETYGTSSIKTVEVIKNAQ